MGDRSETEIPRSGRERQDKRQKTKERKKSALPYDCTTRTFMLSIAFPTHQDLLNWGKTPRTSGHSDWHLTGCQ